MSRALASRALMALFGTLAASAACGRLEDALSPGRRDVDATPALVGLSATIPAFARGQIGAAQVRVQAYYLRTNSARVTLATQQLPLADVPTQQLPITIGLSTCLADGQRAGEALGTGRSAVCVVWLDLALLDGDRVVDEQTVGPLRLRAGGAVTVADPVQLFEVASVEVAPSGSAPPSSGSVRLELGSTVSLAATVISTSGQPVDGRPVQWTSDAPAVARVDPTSGVVVGVGVGRARITATAGIGRGAIVVGVVPRPSALSVVGATASGSGVVRSSPAGIDCHLVAGQPQEGSVCTFTFPGDAQVTFTATPDGGAAFTGWGAPSGETPACVSGGPMCTVDASQPRNVTATFTALRTLTVLATGTGTGTVRSAPLGIDCVVTDGVVADTARMCHATYLDSTTVTLTAAATGLQTFVGWGGACASSLVPWCDVTLRDSVRVVARFEAPVGLSVGLTGSGVGSITVGASGSTVGAGTGTGGGQALVCTTAQVGACVATLPFGTVVTLTAAANPTSTFAGWTGPCSGTGPCQVTVQSASSIGAVFTATQLPLTLTLGGIGAGTVIVNGQTACALAANSSSTTCQTVVAAGSAVTLVAVPAGGATFGGWTGACAASQAATCTLTATSGISVGVAFTPSPPQLTLGASAGGSGSGRVTSVPAGIDCVFAGASVTGACAAPFPSGGSVTLTAVPNAGSTFAGWGGACVGSSPVCTVSVATAQGVAATFTTSSTTAATLDVVLAGTGTGTVTSSPGGVTCPGVCATTFGTGTTVTLTAVPNAGSTFAGWAGACAGATATCAVSLGASANVTATFTAQQTSTFTLATSVGGAGAGTIASNPAGILCPGTCAANYAAGTVVTLTAAAASGSTFAGWGGACSGTGACAVTMSGAQNVAATFNATPTFALSVSIAGTGTGTVTSSPTGISCPTACAAAFGAGTQVTLVAAPTNGSVFLGWTGACSGNGACQVTMSQARAVTATFRRH